MIMNVAKMNGQEVVLINVLMLQVVQASLAIRAGVVRCDVDKWSWATPSFSNTSGEASIM